MIKKQCCFLKQILHRLTLIPYSHTKAAPFFYFLMLCSVRVPPGLSFLLFHFQYHSLWPLTIAFLPSAFAAGPAGASRLRHWGWGAVVNKGVLPAVTASPPCTLGSIQLPPAPGESWASCLSSSSSETQLRVGLILWSLVLSHQQLD